MKKEEYIEEILDMCEAMQDEPEYVDEILGTKTKGVYEDAESLGDWSSDKLREYHNLSKLYLNEYVQVRLRAIKSNETYLGDPKLLSRLGSENLGTSVRKLEETPLVCIEHTYKITVDGMPLTDSHVDMILADAIADVDEKIRLRKLLQKYIRKELKCVSSQSVYQDSITKYEQMAEKIKSKL